MADQIVMKPKEWFKPPRRCRTVIDQAELRELADNMVAIGILHPLHCLVTGEVISGNRRRLASLLDDRLKMLPAMIVSDELTAKELRIRRISENLQRADSLLDKFEECQGLLEEEPGATQADVARLLHVHPSTVTRIMSLDTCIPEVRAAADTIGIAAVYKLSGETPERQAELLARILDKGRKQLGGSNCTMQSGDGQSTPPPSFTIHLPEAKAVTLKGADSYDATIELLKKALADVEAAKRTKDVSFKLYKLALRDRRKLAEPVKPAADLVAV
jgi:ParB-like chromosome segregation protein Spo0J